MNTRFVEAFLQVARLKSFRAAADHLHLTQAAVSNRIQSLEEEIGARVFDRESRTVRLTAIGQRLMDYAERMLDLEQEMRLLGQPGSDLLGLVRIGATDFIVHSWLIHFLKSLQATYPGIEVQLSSETVVSVERALREGTIDVALQTHQIDSDGITSIPCPSVATGWIGPMGFSVEMSDALNHLLRLPCITMSRGSHPDMALRELFRKAQMPVGQIHHVSSIAAMVQLVEAGFGNALLPLAAARPYVEAGRVKVIDCQTPLPHQPTVVSYIHHHSQDAIRRVAELACRVSGQFARDLPDPYKAE